MGQQKRSFRGQTSPDSSTKKEKSSTASLTRSPTKSSPIYYDDTIGRSPTRSHSSTKTTKRARITISAPGRSSAPNSSSARASPPSGSTSRSASPSGSASTSTSTSRSRSGSTSTSTSTSRSTSRSNATVSRSASQSQREKKQTVQAVSILLTANHKDILTPLVKIFMNDVSPSSHERFIPEYDFVKEYDELVKSQVQLQYVKNEIVGLGNNVLDVIFTNTHEEYTAYMESGEFKTIAQDVLLRNHKCLYTVYTYVIRNIIAIYLLASGIIVKPKTPNTFLNLQARQSGANTKRQLKSNMVLVDVESLKAAILTLRKNYEEIVQTNEDFVNDAYPFNQFVKVESEEINRNKKNILDTKENVYKLLDVTLHLLNTTTKKTV
jgi:hypothetical protein